MTTILTIAAKRFALLLFLFCAPLVVLGQTTPGQVIYPSALDSRDSLGQTANKAKTTLTVAATSSSTTLTVVSTTGFPATGLLSLEETEIVSYTGLTSTTFTGVSRGKDGTSGVTHAIGKAGELRVISKLMETRTDAIISLEGKLGIGASTPTVNQFLIGSGTGQSAWGALPASVPTSIMNDANVTGSISSNILSLGWSGALAKSRQNPATAYLDAVNSWSPGIKQTFAPNSTTPGFNPGSVAGNPSTLSNGDLWYDSAVNLLKARINGTTTSLGGGISSLGGQTGSTQSFASSNDTNITLSIGSASNTHTFAISWSGVLAKARQNGNTIYNDAANSWSTGAQDFGSATSLKVPTGAGASPTASGLLAYDSTANAYKFGANGSTKTALMADGSGANLTFPGNLSIATGKTATISNTLTFTGTDGASVALGAGGAIGPVGYSLAGQIAATATNDNATAGKVGEFISSSVSSGSPVSLSTGVTVNLTSMSLTAGDWDVWFEAVFAPAGSTTVSLMDVSISQTSAAFSFANGDFFQVAYPGLTIGTSSSVTCGPSRQSLASTTTVYGVIASSFGTSTMAAYGILRARRVR
jgi:hypothetical protein